MFSFLFSAGVYLRIAGHRHSGILYLSPVPSIPVPDWGPLSGTGLVPASEFLFIPVPDLLYAGQSDIPAFKKAVVVGGERDTQSTFRLKVVESETPCPSKDGC